LVLSMLVSHRMASRSRLLSAIRGVHSAQDLGCDPMHLGLEVLDRCLGVLHRGALDLGLVMVPRVSVLKLLHGCVPNIHLHPSFACLWST
jgi:hypothetical protein